jgi:hypothetical protein
MSSSSESSITVGGHLLRIITIAGDIFNPSHHRTAEPHFYLD